MRRFVSSVAVRTILTVLSLILVVLIALFYIRAVMKGYIWFD
jgi:hypothetical protein